MDLTFQDPKTRDLFKKIRDTNRTFHAKMGSIKDRNGMDLTEAEDTKKRWQEYTEELYKKDFHDQYNHDGMITHLESDILKCKVKWALGSITTNKASGGDGIPADQAPLSMGILQAIILEWVAIHSRRSSQPRDQTQVSCIAGRFFTK